MTGRSATHVVVVQLLLGVATVALVFVLARRLLGAAAATVTALVLAVDPISVVMTSNLTTETLFAAIVVAAALLWVHGLRAPSLHAIGLAGLLVGLSVLVRPVGLYLPVLLVPLTYALWRGPRARRALAAGALLLAFAVPVGLWLARNAAETGVASVSTIQAHNLLDYRAADALAIDTGGSRVAVAQRLDAEVAAHTRPGANAAQVAQVAQHVALRTLLHHPKGAVVATAKGAARVLFGPGRAELLRLVRGYTSPRNALDRVLLVVEGVVLAVVLALACAGLVSLVRRRLWLALAATLTFAAYDVLLAAGAEGNARLRMPAMPFFAVLAAAGALALRRRTTARRGP